MPIRCCIAAASLLALAACGKSDGNTSASAGGGDARFKPGEWEMTVETIKVEAPGLPPAALAAMKPPKVTSKSCMTPEEAEGPKGDFFSGKQGGNCTQQGFQMAGGRISGTTVCTGDRGAGKMTMTMDGQYTPETMDIGMKMTTDVGGQHIAMEARTVGRRIGDCPTAG